MTAFLAPRKCWYAVGIQKINWLEEWMNECLHVGMNGWCIGNMVLSGLNQGAFLSGKTGPAAGARSCIFLGTGCLPTLPQGHYWSACWVISWSPEGTLTLKSQALEPFWEAPQSTCQRHHPPVLLHKAMLCIASFLLPSPPPDSQKLLVLCIWHIWMI